MDALEAFRWRAMASDGVRMMTVAAAAVEGAEAASANR